MPSSAAAWRGDNSIACLNPLASDRPAVWAGRRSPLVGIIEHGVDELVGEQHGEQSTREFVYRAAARPGMAGELVEGVGVQHYGATGFVHDLLCPLLGQALQQRRKSPQLAR